MATCPVFTGGVSGSINYRRTFSGTAAADIAVASNGCEIRTVTNETAGLQMRTLPIDNSDGGTESNIGPSTAAFTLASRDSVFVLGFNASLNIYRTDGGGASSIQLAGGSSMGAVGLYRGPLGLQLMTHSSLGNDYHWMVANVTTRAVVDGGLSACAGVRPNTVAVTGGETQLLTGAVTPGTCSILTSSINVSGNGAFRAMISPDGGVALINVNGGGPNTRVLVGAGGSHGIFSVDTGPFATNVTVYVFDGGSAFPNTGGPSGLARSISNVKLVELLVSPSGDFYLVGSTTGGTQLGSGYPVPYDAGNLSDPFVAKFDKTFAGAPQWVMNFGGAADEFAKRAVLVGNQLLIVGTCGASGASALCNCTNSTCITSIAP